MKWYWKARIYSSNGQYAFIQITTDRQLCLIGAIQDFYKEITGCKMLLEGMSETPYAQVNGFHIIWGVK